MSVIFYGAGQNCNDNFSRWCESGLRPVCICDANRTLHHKMYRRDSMNIKILPLIEALLLYPDYTIYLTLTQENISSTVGYLMNLGIPVERIRHCDFPERSIYANFSFEGLWDGVNLYQSLNTIFVALQDELSRDLFFGRLEYSLSSVQAGIYRTMAADSFISWVNKKRTFGTEFYGDNVCDMWHLLRRNYPVQKDSIYLLGVDDDWNEYNWVVKRFLEAMPKLGINIYGCIMPYSDSLPRCFMGVNCVSEDVFLSNVDDRTKLIVGFPAWLPQTKSIIERYDGKLSAVIPIADTARPQYIETDILEPEADEIFVDVGVFDLESSISFAYCASRGYKKIYAFEPNPKCYADSLKKLNTTTQLDINKVELINKGLGSKCGELSFPVKYNSHGGVVSEDGYVNVEVVTLDSYLNGKQVTFIKMDVEGAELDVLMGMKETIKMHKPKLAVCIYHKREDLINLSAFILNLVPEYKFYIRHYNSNETETVLFCKV